MTQNNLYMENDELSITVNVKPEFADVLENSKNAAAASAAAAGQSETNATNALNGIINYKNSLEIFYAQASDNLTTLLNSAILSLNNCKDSISSNIQTLGNSVLNNINTLFNQIKTTVQTMGQSYVEQARGYAEEAQNTVDNRVSLEHLNQSKALETGDISDDSDVLPWVKRLAHSTYCGHQTEGSTPGYLSDGITPLNPKKFTIVGSPVITSDGIASGFSSSNYLTISQNIDWSKPFTLYAKFKRDSLSVSNPRIIGFNGTTGADGYNNILAFASSTSTTYRLSLVVGGVETNISKINDVSMGIFELGKYYDIILSFDGNQTYQLKYKESSASEYINCDNITNSGTMSFSNGTVIGYVFAQAFDGSIDIKQFSITVDGVEVFSGNKTGVDTIKADDYTVVGTPTISADGVASGFSISNSVSTNSLNLSGKFHIHHKFKLTQYNQNGSFSTLLQSIVTGTVPAVFIGVNVAGLVYLTLTDDGTNWSHIGNNTSPNTVSLNTEHDFDFYYDGTTYKVDIDNVNYCSITSNDTIYNINNISFRVGSASFNADANLTGSIDLNSFKVYVDGDLVYQPCLKIPYTESKTGSKIVDSYYRNRVNDMYEQFGFAPYYTLSDTDFTLPQGEIYGMIERLRTQINGLSS